MRRAFKSLLFAVAAVAVPGESFAADIKTIPLGDDGVAIVLLGEIKKGDGARFRAEAGKHDDAVVLLESDGGSTTEAIEIGEAIRIKGFTTAVTNGSSCNSACGLIWLAGSPRALSKSGRVGFHATYVENKGSAVESGVGNAIVGRYLTLLNLPERAVVFATNASPNNLNWLTSSNYHEAGIDVTVIDDIDWDEKSTAKREPIAKNPESTLWKKTGGWIVAIDNTLEQSCFLLSSFDNETIFRIGINATAPDEYYLALANPNWTSLKAGDVHQLELQFDQEGPWDVPMKAVKMGSSIMLLGTFSDTGFWAEFVSAKYLRVRRESTNVTTISMGGTKAGFDEMVRCQTSQLSRRKTPSDPFAK